MNELPLPDDRRRRDRRSEFVRLADYTIPELRKAVITGALLLAILGLFLYMVRDVLIATVVGVVLGVYLIPFHRWLERHVERRSFTAILTILLVIVPLAAILIYSWIELSGAAQYLSRNSASVAAQLNEAVHRLPFFGNVRIEDDLPRWVAMAGQQTGEIVDELKDAIGIVSISVAVFLFTTFYILTDHARIAAYIRSRIPGRYQELAGEVSENIRAVTYGALYATFLTQLAKSLVILALNLLFDVPLAVVLAIVAFFIGFLPIVGSWAVYLPVAAYLAVFQNNTFGAIVMVLVGSVVNTLFISMYLRPKIAAEKSRVLNFYWMFIALVTGVYTFGLVGVLIGPVLIAVLKAVFDTITTESTSQILIGEGSGGEL